MLVAVAASSALALFWPAITKGAANGVQPTEAVLLMNREKAVVIDVCEPAEFAQGHVVGSKNIPLAQLEAQLPQVVKNKNLPVIMVCQVGGRASRAAAQAQKLGFERAQALSGGLKSWREANLPVEKA
ncbi:MAG: Thiosulfate sulfurtransferase PspE precursor [Pseudomonadota bacterium]